MTESTDRLEKDVSAIALPGGRTVGSSGHREVRAYLESRLRDIGLTPYRGDSFVLPYRRGGVDFYNLVGVVPGADRSAPPLLIGAHYDSIIAAPCADDNAAAVAVALDTMRSLLRTTPSRDVVVALFDAEEPPYFHSEAMGSIRFYHDQMDERGVQVALIMDLVGHDVALAAFPLEELGERIASLLFLTGAESHSTLVEVLREASPPAGLRIAAALNRYVGDMSDQKVFRENGIPYLFLSCGRWEHYHQLTDTVERLNFAKIARVALFLTDLAGMLAERGDLERREPESDPVQLEVDLLRKALGEGFEPITQLLGIDRLETRADMDRFAQGLLSLGL